MNQCPDCGFYSNGPQCQLAAPGPDHKRMAAARVTKIEWAYREMKNRGWGFTSNGEGFGDPSATFTVVGPYDGTLVEQYGMDPDAVKAVEQAIAKAVTI